MVTLEEIKAARGLKGEVLEAELDALNSCAPEFVVELIKLGHQQKSGINSEFIPLKTKLGGAIQVNRWTAISWLKIATAKREKEHAENARKHLEAAKKNEKNARRATCIAGVIMIATIVQVGIAFFETFTEKSPVYTISLQEAASAPTAASQ